MVKDRRSYQDRKDYLKKAVTKRRRLLKQKAVTVAGGRCVICGYDKHPGVLDFHHLDSSSKLFGISSGGLSRSWASIEKEISKCVLVCANCHREIELDLTKLPDLYLQK